MSGAWQAALAVLVTIIALGPLVALFGWMLHDADRMGLDLRLFPPRDERGRIVPPAGSGE